MGAKLPILDVRCKDASGATFVVEMQLIHVPGFIDRVVYNACKAYVGQLVMDEIEQAREYGEVKEAAGFARGHESGLVEGKRDALLRVLMRRGLVVTEEERAQISTCTEVVSLDRWFDSALMARTMAEVFT